MLILQNIRYTHPNGEMLFDNLSLSVSKQDKIALIGNNGVGKSTLLSILAGNTQPTEGSVTAASTPYYVPQLFGQYNDYTVAQALRVDGKLTALEDILSGNVTEANMTILNDDWGIVGSRKGKLPMPNPALRRDWAGWVTRSTNK